VVAHWWHRLQWRTPVGVGCLVVLLTAGAVVPAPSAARQSEAQALQVSPRFFPETGYTVERDAFWNFFERRGGLRTFGYPVGNAFSFLGCLSQFFQRVVVQQCGADAPVATLNLLDELLPYTRINGSTFPAPEADLLAQAPAVGDPDYGARAITFVRAHAPNEFGGHSVGFLATFLSTVRYEDAFPGGEGDPGLMPLLNLELWGLPTSRPHADPGNPGFVYQRFQRCVMHYDAGCGCTQGLLLADYLKAVITGDGLPADLEAQAQGSPLYRSEGRGAPSTDYTGAFRPAGERPPAAGAPLRWRNPRPCPSSRRPRVLRRRLRRCPPRLPRRRQRSPSGRRGRRGSSPTESWWRTCPTPAWRRTPASPTCPAM